MADVAGTQSKSCTQQFTIPVPSIVEYLVPPQGNAVHWNCGTAAWFRTDEWLEIWS